MKPIECCGKIRDTRFCPSCGRQIYTKTFFLYDTKNLSKCCKGEFDDDGNSAYMYIRPPGEKQGEGTMTLCVDVSIGNGGLSCIVDVAENENDDVITLFSQIIDFPNLKRQIAALSSEKST